MPKDELSLKEREVIQHHFGDPEFFAAFDHFLAIERSTWQKRMTNAARAGAENVDPVARLMVINESAAKAGIYESFFIAINNRTAFVAESVVQPEEANA